MILIHLFLFYEQLFIYLLNNFILIQNVSNF